MPRDGSTTRSRILSTSLRLFIEQGYDKTSLREIADAVGVTKAALYYHFRTKDDIVRAAFEDLGAEVEQIAEWLGSAPPGVERNAGFADRILGLMGSRGLLALRFAQANPTVMAREKFGALQTEVTHRLLTALVGDTPTTQASLRAILAYAVLMLGTVDSFGESEGLPVAGSLEERRDAARAIALELLAPVSGR